MVDVPPDSPPNSAPSDVARPNNERAGSAWRMRALVSMMMGFGLLYGSMILMWLFWGALREWPMDDTKSITILSVGIVFIVGLLYSGLRICISSLSVRRDIIIPEDRSLLEPLIVAGDSNAIDQYIRLSSLTGITGTATKLGISGLPLLTIAMTLIFSGLEIYKPDVGFMDLTKLTLGAFIGSFVQRSATAQAAIETGRIPNT